MTLRSLCQLLQEISITWILSTNSKTFLWHGIQSDRRGSFNRNCLKKRIYLKNFSKTQIQTFLLYAPMIASDLILREVYSIQFSFLLQLTNPNFSRSSSSLSSLLQLFVNEDALAFVVCINIDGWNTCFFDSAEVNYLKVKSFKNTLTSHLDNIEYHKVIKVQ